jgi:hypothetical protein
MSKAKFERQTGLTAQEAIVKRMVGQSQEAQAEEQAKAEGKDGRGKPGNAGEIGIDKRGQGKVTYYLSVSRQNLVKEMATAEEVSQTDIVEAAVVAFYNVWRAGKLDLDDLKSATKSLRVLWKLDVPDKFGFFSDDTQH